MTKHTGTPYWGTAVNRTRKVKLRLSLLRHDETNVKLRLTGTDVKVDVTMPTAELEAKTDLARSAFTPGAVASAGDLSLPGLPIGLFLGGRGLTVGLTVTDAVLDGAEEQILVPAGDWAAMMQDVCDLVHAERGAVEGVDVAVRLEARADREERGDTTDG